MLVRQVPQSCFSSLETTRLFLTPYTFIQVVEPGCQDTSKKLKLKKLLLKLNSCISLRRTDFFTLLSLIIYEHGISLHLLIF